MEVWTRAPIMTTKLAAPHPPPVPALNSHQCSEQQTWINPSLCLRHLWGRQGIH